jgi:predicted N-acetyltransferase YhbS
MALRLRRGTPADAPDCGRICFEAFRSIAERHHFPPDFPSPEIASALMAVLLSHPKFYATVAELDGRIVGSNFLDERNIIAGIGPISVNPDVQQKGVGRRLMEDALERASQHRSAGVRLVQVAYNNQSLSLYTKLGFRSREPLSLLSGALPKLKLAGYDVRSASEADIDACSRLCVEIHGHDRRGEIEDAVRAKTATVVEHLGRVTGYATALGYFAHAVSKTNDNLIALIGAAEKIDGPGMLVPTRNHALLSWCLDNKFRLVQQMSLMTIGLYCEPTGAYLPSVLY